LLHRMLGLLATGLLAGVACGTELSISCKQHAAVSTAMRNADRHYRLASSGARGSSGDGGAAAALAFRSVAQVYLEVRSDASLLAAALAVTDVAYLGTLWYACGDLSASAAAALLVNWVDYAHLHDAVAAVPADAASK